jgi:hypothetical protein
MKINYIYIEKNIFTSDKAMARKVLTKKKKQMIVNEKEKL